MSILKNTSGLFMPHFEQRRSAGTLVSSNGEIIHDVNGDSHAIIYINGTGTVTGAYAISGSVDGVNFFDLPAYPFTPGCTGGTVPVAGQPFVNESVNAATLQRVLCVATGGLQKIRLRITSYSSGSFAITINSDSCDSLSPFVRHQRASTINNSTTGAVGAAVTASLFGVTSLRHYIGRISVVRSATMALTPSAIPVIVTTTNLPGAPNLTFGADAGGVGVDKEMVLDFGSTGLAATAATSNTTILCPAYAGVIWRVNVSYWFGL